MTDSEKRNECGVSRSNGQIITNNLNLNESRIDSDRLTGAFLYCTKKGVKISHFVLTRQKCVIISSGYCLLWTCIFRSKTSGFGNPVNSDRIKEISAGVNHDKNPIDLNQRPADSLCFDYISVVELFLEIKSPITVCGSYNFGHRHPDVKHLRVSVRNPSNTLLTNFFGNLNYSIFHALDGVEIIDGNSYINGRTFAVLINAYLPRTYFDANPLKTFPNFSTLVKKLVKKINDTILSLSFFPVLKVVPVKVNKVNPLKTFPDLTPLVKKLLKTRDDCHLNDVTVKMKAAVISKEEAQQSLKTQKLKKNTENTVA
ncbi:hypothetical protein GQR58_025330 [Nymphon striatum]|nr:hypothetical protein GQR58_025330 [Nymphon striatum]